MATIGTLAVNIVATTDKFIAGLNNAQGRLGKFAKGIATAQTFLVGLGVVGFGAVVKGAVDAGGALADLSAKLNISTEALGALQFASSQLGGTEQGLQAALAFMTRQLGELSNGSKAANEAFMRIGLTWKQLRGLQPEQQFLAIVDAINKLPTRMDQAAAAQKVFGRGARDLMSVIAAGTDEIIRFGDEAAAAGILVSTETAQAMDEASDSISKLVKIWEGLKISMVGTYAPEITGAVEMIEIGIQKLIGAIKFLQVSYLRSMEAILERGKSVINGINALLPKSLEISTQPTDVLTEEFARRRRELQTPATKGPLSAPNMARIQAANEMQVKQLDTLIQEVRKSPVKVAGVR